MNENVNQKLAESLTSDTTAIIPYLPYLLQDFWELGSSPDDMLQLIQRHIRLSDSTKVLDLGCGKGAVSIKLAKELQIRFKGIDLISDFIDYAKEKAEVYGVSELCDFEVADINNALKTERGYDCVIFGAVGNVIGNYQEMLQSLLPTVKKEGYIIIDDAYVDEQDVGIQSISEDIYPAYQEWLELFEEMNVEMIECLESRNSNSETELHWIIKRADELMKQFPEEKSLFEKYVENQRKEYDDLNTNLIGATWLLRKKCNVLLS